MTTLIAAAKETMSALGLTDDICLMILVTCISINLVYCTDYFKPLNVDLTLLNN